MKKLVFLFSIISFCILSGFISPDMVFASTFTPFKDPGISSVGVDYIYGQYTFNWVADTVGTPYSVYYFGPYQNAMACTLISFSIDENTVSPSNNLSSYTYTFEGVSHTVYYSIYGMYGLSSDTNFVDRCYGTKLLEYSDSSSFWPRVCNYFLFGEGSLDFEMPPQDIPDSDLDIVGLSAYILNDQTGSVDWYESSKNLMMNFYSAVLETFFDITKSMEETALDPGLLQGSIVNYIPGVALAWNAPPLDSDISYSVWVDGISKINYKTSIDPISNYLNTQQIDSFSYSKLQINDSTLVQSGSVYYQYNTNQGLQTILEFIENNSSLNPPSNIHPWNRYSYVSLETTISRVYIQASKVIDGDRHYGALSYVDIVDGQPIVHEGVTDDISDITPSDPGTTGTTTTTGVPMTTSGNTIYTGDTITNNNEYNYNYGTGLIVGTSNPLGFIKRLFSAIFDLIQSLYLAFLVPFILLGMTGSTGGIL